MTTTAGRPAAGRAPWSCSWRWCTGRSATTWPGSTPARSTGGWSAALYRLVRVDPDTEQRWTHLRGRRAGLLVRLGRAALPAAAAAAAAAARLRPRRRRRRRRAAGDGVQHRRLVRDQHELAVLRAGDRARAHRADGRPDRAERRVGRGRDGGRGRAGPRVRPLRHRPARQLLGRPDPRRRPDPAAVLVRRRDRCWSPWAWSMSLRSGVDVTGVDGAQHTLPLAPAASQEAIKELGTNGGGIFNANSAHPFENPNALSNLVRDLPAAGHPGLPDPHVRHHGRQHAAGHRAGRRHGRASGPRCSPSTWLAETDPERPGALAAGAAMEGKEVRFGIPASIAVRGVHHRHVDRRGQLAARQLHRRRRAGSRC